MPKTKTPQHYPDAVRETTRWLESSGTLGHLSWWERFARTVDLWFYGFKRDEPNYMRAVKALGDEGVREATKIVGALVHTMVTAPQDLLGKVYQTIGANDKKRFAQSFTPDNISAAMAKMSLVGIEQQMFRKIGGVVIGEPACGAGTMAIHSAVEIHDSFGTFGTERTHLVCNDIDLTCCQMTALQLLWLSMRFPIGCVTVTQGDSLRPETQTFLATFGSGTLPRYTRRIRRVQ